MCRLEKRGWFDYEVLRKMHLKAVIVEAEIVNPVNIAIDLKGSYERALLLFVRNELCSVLVELENYDIMVYK